MARSSNITMAGIARLAGVSVSTVSRALAGNPAIAAATRKQVEALAREHGFAPNPLARGLRRQRTETIGVVMPLGHQRDQHMTDPFIMTMIGHLADCLAEQGYDMLLRRLVPQTEDWLERLAGSGRVDGLIVLGQSDQHEVLNRAARRFPALVVWGGHLDASEYPIVGSDNRRGGTLAARHLIAQGRGKLLFLGQESAPEFVLRRDGFRTECARHADVRSESAAVDLVPETAHAQLTALLHDRTHVDGIFAASDVIALAAIDVLEQQGRLVPQDVSVVGYDNVALPGLGARPLTTIDQHLAQGARTLVATLLRAIAGEEVAAVKIEPTLVVRSTSVVETQQ